MVYACKCVGIQYIIVVISDYYGLMLMCGMILLGFVSLDERLNVCPAICPCCCCCCSVSLFFKFKAIHIHMRVTQRRQLQTTVKQYKPTGDSIDVSPNEEPSQDFINHIN